MRRTTPDAPASVELSDEEISVLKRDQESRGVKKKRVVPEHPTLKDVTRWLGQLGGWIDQKGNGELGATTIGRGLERLPHLVYAFREKVAKRRKATIST